MQGVGHHFPHLLKYNCANGKKPIFRKSPPCSDGSRPQCPAKRCSKRPATIEHVNTANDSIESNYILGNTISVNTESFITEKHIDYFPYEALEDINENVTLFNPDADQIPQCKQVSNFRYYELNE